MRIVMSAFGTRGDTQPFVVLGSELQRRGHDVVLCGLREFAGLAEPAGVPYLPCDFGDIGELLRAGLRGTLQGDLTPGRRELLARIRETVRGQFRVLGEVACDADLVVGTGVNLAFRSAGEAAAALVRFVGFTPTLFPSARYAPWVLPWHSLGRPLNALAWLLYERVPMAPNEARAALGLPPVEWSFSRAMAHDLKPILAADDVIAPLPGEIAQHVVQVSAIVPPADDALPIELEEFLAAGDPPVFVGFNSMPVRDPARTTRDVLAAARALGLRLVAGSGWARLAPEGVRDVIVADDVCHAALFPRCAAVVHHGGAGTTAQACRAGVPQVVVPHLADQQLWASRVTHLGLGVQVHRRYLTAGSLRPRLQRVLSDERYRFSAQVMAERLSGRDGAAAAADALLQTDG